MGLETDRERSEWEVDGEKVTAHYSSLTLHRKCPQAWYYRYELGLHRAPDGRPAPARDFGSWWSAVRATESLERGRQLGSLIGKPRKFGVVDGIKFDMATVTLDEVFDAVQIWWDHYPETHREEWMSTLGDEPVPHLAKRLEAHMERWGDEIAKERPLGVEVFWKRELPRPAGDVAWDGDIEGMPAMFLLGYIDEVYLDVERNLVVVRDHKTTSGELRTQTVVEDMMDSQLELYAWGVTPMLKAEGLDPVRAVAYDRMRSVAPQPPRVTTAGKLYSRGGESSIGMTDLQTYLEWAKGPDGQGVPYLGRKPAGKEAAIAGYYVAEQDVIERLKLPSARSAWFQRKRVPLNLNLVRTHLRAAVDSTTDIWRTQKRTQRTAEAARNLSRENCRWCDFAQFCQAQMRGGPRGVWDLAELGLRGRDNATELVVGEKTGE
jgi:hypothetical protein